MAFQSKTELKFIYDTFNNTVYEIDKVNHKTVLETAKKYCDNSDCKSNILQQIDLNLLNFIINTIF